MFLVCAITPTCHKTKYPNKWNLPLIVSCWDQNASDFETEASSHKNKQLSINLYIILINTDTLLWKVISCRLSNDFLCHLIELSQ